METSWLRYLPAAVRSKLEQLGSNTISNTGWLFADNFLRASVGFLVGIKVTRYLGPEQFGRISYAVAFVAIFTSISLLGLDSIVIRNLTRQPGKKTEILGTAFVLKLIGGMASCGLIVALSYSFQQENQLLRPLIIVTSFGLIFQATGAIDYWFQSQTKAKFIAIARSGAFILAAAAKLVLVGQQAPLIAFAWIGTAEIACCAFGLIATYRYSGEAISSWRPSPAAVVELLKDSWPLLLTDLVIMINSRADKLIVGNIAGARELGTYAVAAMIAEALLFVPLSLYSTHFPGLVTAQQSSAELFEAQTRRFYNLMAFSAYAIAIPMTLLGGWGIRLLFGETYASAGPMLIGLTWSGLFISLGMARSGYLTAMNWTRLHFLVDLLACLVNIGLNLLLVPMYGANGAVVAVLLSCWFATHGSCFIFKPLRQTGKMLTRAMLCPKFW